MSPASTEGLEVGCHKILYAPLSGSEAFNRRFSLFVWRNVFNLPATLSYARERHQLDPVSERIRADLDRDGYAVTSVAELDCEAAFGGVQAEAAALVDQVRARRKPASIRCTGTCRRETACSSWPGCAG